MDLGLNPKLTTYYSCLENPRDGGACWAAVCGVTQSWTRLKRLSSSSSSICTHLSLLCFLTRGWGCFLLYNTV